MGHCGLRALRRSRLTPVLLAFAFFAVAESASAAQRAQSRCTVPKASAAYAGAVAKATRSGRDIWGEKLLRSPAGPSYEAAARHLAPIHYALGAKRRPLTSTGAYYLAFTQPRREWGDFGYALHVADGSEIVTRRAGGSRLGIWVGDGRRERYGSCVGRLEPPRLAQGYLPILQTSYRDTNGVRYTQESFAGRLTGARGIVSFIRVVADARGASRGATVSLRATPAVARDGDRLVTADGARLIVEAGTEWRSGGFRIDVEPGERRVLHALVLHTPSPARRAQATRGTYDAARAEVVRYWDGRLAEGARISVPEERVQDAWRGIMIQQLAHVWRYSIGNQYEQLSFAEALDTAEVMAAFGHREIARTILRASLVRLPFRPTAWRAAEHLVAAATYYRLHGDAEFLTEAAADLERALVELETRQRAGFEVGQFMPERFSSDIARATESVTTHLVAWQGLLAMSRVWRETGNEALAARADALVGPLETAVRLALRKALVRMRDGSIFVRPGLNDDTRPHTLLTDSRDGSYWNLVVPYAFASGWFRPGGSEARGILRYLENYGSQLLGVTRADAHVVYGPAVKGASGLGHVYGLSVSRFLADNDRADRLDLALYGMLGVGMTRGTYVSGEAITVTPRRGAWHRTMYLPPNQGANSTFLETLRLTLVHERRSARGEPAGLELAFATPRRWLARGGTIRVEAAPTSFGPLSFVLSRRGDTIEGTVELPPRATSVKLRLRVPRGARVRTVVANGRVLRADARGTVDLSPFRGAVTLRAVVR